MCSVLAHDGYSNLNTFKQITTTLKITFKWDDEYLRWDPNDHSHPLTFTADEIWTPDIIVSNLVYHKQYDYNKRYQYLIVVQPNGSVHWTFPTKFVSTCPVNQDMHPYERASCSIEFRSSAYSSDQIVLKKNRFGVDAKLLGAAEFDFINYTIHDTEMYLSEMEIMVSCLNVKFQMKRNSLYYLNKIIFPYCVFYIITIFTFLLPVDSGEKKSYCTSIFISALIFLKENYFYIPKSSILPMITVFFSINLVLMQVSIISTIIIYAIYHVHYKSKSSPCLLTCFHKTDINKHLEFVLVQTNINQIAPVITNSVYSDLNLKNCDLDRANAKLAFLTLSLIKSIKFNFLQEHTRNSNYRLPKLLNALEHFKNVLTTDNTSNKIYLKNDKCIQEAYCYLLDLLRAIKHRLANQNKLESIKKRLLSRLTREANDFSLQDYCENYEVNLQSDTFRPCLNKYRVNNLVLNSKWKYVAIILDRVLFTLYACVAPSCLVILYLKVSQSNN